MTDAIALVILASCCCLLGWTRLWRPSGDAFRQAEVIVAAHVVPGTVRMHPPVGGAQEFGAVLRVEVVLKGVVDDTEVAVTLHHGLTPVVGGYLCGGLITIDAGHRREGVIEIYDTSNGGGGPFVADAREEHLWLLGRHPEYWPYQGYSAPESAGRLGVTEPDEVLAADKPTLDQLLHEGDSAINAAVAQLLFHRTRRDRAAG